MTVHTTAAWRTIRWGDSHLAIDPCAVFGKAPAAPKRKANQSSDGASGFSTLGQDYVRRTSRSSLDSAHAGLTDPIGGLVPYIGQGGHARGWSGVLLAALTTLGPIRASRVSSGPPGRGACPAPPSTHCVIFTPAIATVIAASPPDRTASGASINARTGAPRRGG